MSRTAFWIISIGTLGTGLILLLVITMSGDQLAIRNQFTTTTIESDANQECVTACDMNCEGFSQETDKLMCLEECEKLCLNS